MVNEKNIDSLNADTSRITSVEQPIRPAADNGPEQRLQSKLAEQSWELAALTLLVRDIETLNDELVDRNEWLGKVSALLAGQSSRRWAPKAIREQRLRAALVRHDLFDGNAYLKRYPDVAAAGMDPLQHYILHGMAEGRQR